MVKSKTYKDFGQAIEELKGEEISYDTISFSTQLSASYIWGLVHKRTSNMPKDHVIKKLADFFHVDTDYFFESRYKKMCEFVMENREFLDVVERESVKWSKANKKTSQNSENEGSKERSA